MTLVGVIALSGPAHASHRLRVAPIQSTPEGKTYGHWAAAWWQWALGVPVATSPLLDETGEHCAVRQVDDVWFLAGSLGGAVERHCTVPAGVSLFFPIVNSAFFAFLNDPPEERTESFVRNASRCSIAVEISAELNGRPVPQLQRFNTKRGRAMSPIFNVQLPPDNLFGVGTDVIPEFALSPSAEEGYYLFVRRPAPGEHTLHWTAQGCEDGFALEVTYHLTVVEGGIH